MNLNKYITRHKNLVAAFSVLSSIVAFMSGFYILEQNTVRAFERTIENEDGQKLENYDIRLDKTSFDKIAGFRSGSNLTAADVADKRQLAVNGEKKLRSSVPSLLVEYNDDLKIPSLISPDPKQGFAVLSKQISSSRPETLKNFLKQNEDLFGIDGNEIENLVVTADYTNPNGELSFVNLEQKIDSIPVFQGVVSSGFNKKGELFRVINDLGPGLDTRTVSTNFFNAKNAVVAAHKVLGNNGENIVFNPQNAVENEKTVTFGEGDWATKAEKVYFPIEPGLARAAWRILMWHSDGGFYVVIDAETDTLLWLKKLTEHQTQSATYKVFSNSNAMIPVADSPNPFTPGPTSPEAGTQGSRIIRNTITRIGNEPPYTFNSNGWITDGQNTTDGNAVEAGLDRESPDGIDPNGKPVPTQARNFTFEFNPSNPSGIPDAGESPLPTGVNPGVCDFEGTLRPMTEFQKASVTQLFYISNWFHDETYRLGFTEQARNFQHDNFGRGGLGGDRISAEAQECTGTNGGGFATAADGQRGRMQMYIWTLPEPDHDGALDAQVVVHELAHGLSNRLIGNATGLTTNMARGMGEGWSDYYAHSMLSEPSDPANGIYTIGGYSNYRPFIPHNNYYGVRRFPLAVMAATGGPNNRPFNPLTFADIDSSQANISDGAFLPNGLGGSADQVHNAGEIWSAALWEVRAKFIQRLGWETGNRRLLQFVTDGMKLTPLAPTFLQSRDAIIIAALMSGTSNDVSDIWSGFAIRGMGMSASIQVPGTGSGNTRVTEAFDQPNLVLLEPFRVFDTLGNNNGYAEPGENVTLFAPLLNSTGVDATGVTIQIVGGGIIDLGTIGHGQTVGKPIPFTIPANTACGSVLDLMVIVNSSLGTASFERKISIGIPNITFEENFDAVSAPALPAGWDVSPVSGGVNFVTTTNSSFSSPNAVFALNPSTVGGGTDLTSPNIPITSGAATVTFMHRYDTEAGWDGGVLEISINGGSYQDIIDAGGSFIYGGYNSVLGSNGVNNPLSGRSAWSGDSLEYIRSEVRIPASAKNGTVRLKWRFGADNNTAVDGWYIDSISVAGNHTCTISDNFNAPFDFDGDLKTDISIFRPETGVWWINQSSGSVVAAEFGNSQDIIVPADYSGDGKDDIAFYRPTTNEWFILRSENGSFYSLPFGAAGDIAVPADYDGDGKADVGIFRPSNRTWYILRSSDQQVSIIAFGSTGDKPVPADYDSDGKADIAIFRPSSGEWWINNSSGQVTAFKFGNSSDKPIQGDYTGDGKADAAFWRRSTGEWFILRSDDFSYYSFPFGLTTDVPVTGDYDGDGRFDAAIFRPSNGIWYIQGSSSGTQITQFGVSGDRPVPSAFITIN